MAATDQSAIVTTSVVQEVTRVGRSNLKPIEQDTDTGLYVRDLQVFALNDDGTEGRLIMTLRLSSPQRSGIELSTPALNF